MKLEKDAIISQNKILSEIGKGGMGESFVDFKLEAGRVLDVRSPVEFEQGHIPGATNFPLFTNDERAEIGVCYKTEGKDAAISRGFDFAGPRFGEMVRRAKELAPGKTVRIHCARGGLRSRSVAWLLETADFRVITLSGGYKSYRNWVREVVGSSRLIYILSGFTGTGKTRILKALQKHRRQALDLEGLANHRGSSFGGLGMREQPTTQHFENLIAEKLSEMNPDKPVWIEAESSRVGTCWVPEELFSLMKSAQRIDVTRPIEERLDILTEMYGQSDRTELIDATKRIAKRLGGERTKAAIELIYENDLREACRIILDYYDRSYVASRKRKPTSPPKLDIGGLSATQASSLLIQKAPMLLSADSQMIS